MGHLSGPYLAADIAARAARARGERVVTTAGFDVHQNCVLTRAETDGVDVDKLVAAYRNEIIDALAAARIQYDVLLDPQSKEYQHGVATLAADLTEAGRFPLRRLMLLACEDCGRTLHHSYVVGTCAWCRSEASGGGCEGCGGYTAAENLVAPRCNRCGGRPQPFRARVPVLSMEDYRQELIEIWLRAELSDRARQIVGRYLDRRLPDVPMAYPTNWGLAGVGPQEGLRLEAYAEVGLSTVYGVAQSLRPGALGLEETAQAWSDVGSLWHFNGIDDAFSFALFWPAVYLARNRPDRYPTDFTLSSYREFEAHVRPLLAGTTRPSALPALLADADVKQGAAALQPQAFDPALAVRSLLTGLAADLPESKQLLWILTGR
jgi:methionyl-tRNA synthetase